MIESVRIRNFQSLHDVELSFGRFTVVVGPSSSGKTALMRAMRALSSNVRGASVITQGRKALAITARTGTATITLQRSETRGEYRVIVDGQPEQIFGKLAGAVPEEVTAALGIDPAPGPNFASQFDAPYLLDESGATVARVLGELTNVGAIFDAVAEANRRKKAAAATLKLRQADLDDVTARAAAFADLDRRAAAVERAEAHAARAEQLRQDIDRLTALTRMLQQCQAEVDRTRLDRPLPDGVTLAQLAARHSALRQTVRDWAQAGLAAQQAAAHAEGAHLRELTAHATLTAALRAAGRCPTCGGEIRVR